MSHPDHAQLKQKDGWMCPSIHPFVRPFIHSFVWIPFISFSVLIYVFIYFFIDFSNFILFIRLLLDVVFPMPFFSIFALIHSFVVRVTLISSMNSLNDCFWVHRSIHCSIQFFIASFRSFSFVCVLDVLIISICFHLFHSFVFILLS